MKKQYNISRLQNPKDRGIVINELNGKKWQMKVQGVRPEGYDLIHETFRGTVFAETQKVLSGRQTRKGDILEVEIAVLKKNKAGVSG